jgi:hypothetical protein
MRGEQVQGRIVGPSEVIEFDGLWDVADGLFSAGAEVKWCYRQCAGSVSREQSVWARMRRAALGVGSLYEWRVIRPEQQFRSSHFGGMAMKLQSKLDLYG